MTVELKTLRQLAKQQGKSLRKVRGGFELRNIGRQKKNAAPDMGSECLDTIAFFLKGGRLREVRTACGMLLWSRDGSP